MRMLSSEEMKHLPLHLVDFSRQMLGSEAKEFKDPADSAQAMECVYQKLLKSLDPVIGSGGFQALVARALYLTKKIFPGPLRSHSRPDYARKGLRESVVGLKPAEASEGFATAVANTLSLLVTLIGEDIVFGLLRGIWTEIEE